MNIYVGNLSTSVRDYHLKELFEPFGKVGNVNILMDFKTGVSKGYGFVEMEKRTDAMTAINRLNNTTFMEQVMEVNESRPNSSIAPRQQFSYRGMTAPAPADKKK